jgi:predicted metal-dependent hydrolase
MLLGSGQSKGAETFLHLKISCQIPDFWKKLELAMPDYEQQKEWLARYVTESDGF